MKAKLIAATEVDPGALRDIGFEVDDFYETGDDKYFGDFDADELAEFAGTRNSSSRPSLSRSRGS